MKKIILLLAFALLHTFCFSQVAPTLGVGLETLTMNKGTIDVKVLTEIITAKQKELKQEALRRFMYKLFPEANYTTKFYIQNCLNILLNEKNPKVIEKEVLKLTTNYALALGVTYALINSKDINNTDLFKDINDSYNKNMQFSPYYFKIKPSNDKNKRIQNLESEITDLKKSIKAEKHIEQNIRKIDRKNKTIARIKIKNNYNLTFQEKDTSSIKKLKIPFGIILDVVSLSLSNIEGLRTKGFYTNKIDYRNDAFYQNLTSDDEKKFKKELDILEDIIKKTIEPYINDYEVIKEFLQHKEDENEKDIKNKLNNLLFAEANKFISTNKNDEWFNSFKTNKNANEEEIRINNTITNILIYSKRIDLKIEIDKAFSRIKTEIINDNKTLDFSDLNTSIEKYNQYHPKHLTLIKSINLNKIDTIISNEKDIPIINDKIIKRISYDDLKEIFNLTKTNNELPKSFKTSVSSEFQKLDDLLSNLNTINEPVKSTTLKDYQAKLNDNYKILSMSDKFNNVIIENKTNEILATILNIKSLNLNIQSSDTIAARKASTFFSELYIKVKAISNNEVKLTNLNELENYAVKNIITLKIFDEKNIETYNKLLEKIQYIILFQKFKIVNKAGYLGNYSNDLANVFEFISNLDKLDEATTYQSLVDMLKNGSIAVEENLPDDKFKDEYILFINAVKKYTIINPTAEKEYISIDVVSFLNDLQQFYNRDNKSIFSLYLTLGLNENFFFNDFKFPDSTEEPVDGEEPVKTEEPIKNIGFASEKIGVKFKIASFKKSRGYENAVIDDVYLNKKAPFLNEFYGIIYGSGLLYSLANTSTNENFDFPHAGLGAGVRFYNALDLNIILGFPFVKDSNFGENMFWGIGLDIPLGEYLEKLGNKN
jgi:hypothetical protein